MEYDGEWVESAHVNLCSVLRREEWLATKRTVKMTWQAAWLLRAVSCVDLTTLSGDDTPGNVTRLCHKAKYVLLFYEALIFNVVFSYRSPVRQDILEKLGFKRPITVGAVCVYPARVKEAVEALKGTGIPVASVATGFPAGQTSLELRLGTQ